MAEQKNSQHSSDKVGLYQLKSGEGYDGLRHCPYARLIKQGKKAYIANYDQMLLGDMLAKDTPIKVLQRFINHLPEDFAGHPIEVGDVIAVRQHGIQSAYYVDDIAGTLVLIALPAFFTKAEDDTETIARGVEEGTEEHRRNTNAEHGEKRDDNTPAEPRVIDGRRSVLDGLKIKKEEVKKYRPPKKHDKNKDKDKEEGMEI